jgi:hypothetical protein
VTIEQLGSKLMELPRDERREFAQWFYKHELEILDPAEDDDISPQVKAEIVRRCDEIERNPSLAIPVTDEWFDQLKKKLALARPGQTSAA